MQIVADLHLHSKYSRAVSQQMVLPEMAKWGKIKGIDLLATGDFTHPLWFREIQTNLEEDGSGILKLKKDNSGIRFLLSTEISSIYSQGGKGRRIHTLFMMPSLASAEKFNAELLKRGANLMSDGRPITGIPVRDLAEIALTVDPLALIIPAHIWTPWFGVLGSQSGFDSLEECFGGMTKYIYGIETGLSSDPIMNWRIKELENRSILSFSDSHSGAKLGREATVFQTKTQSSKLKTQNQMLNVKSISYQDVYNTIKGERNSDWEIGYTVDFHPEEGKYHYTGHRNCGIKQTPMETKKLGTTCTVCGKKLTVGVMHRVEQLANQPEFQPTYIEMPVDGHEVKMITNPEKTKIPYIMLVPLAEILAEALGVRSASKKTDEEYNKLISNFGSEFKVLLSTPITEIARVSGEKIAVGVEKVRMGNIYVDPGYDGVFGTVRIWGKDHAEKMTARKNEDICTEKPKRSQMTLDL